jgi:hypothetical protein
MAGPGKIEAYLALKRLPQMCKPLLLTVPRNSCLSVVGAGRSSRDIKEELK